MNATIDDTTLNQHLSPDILAGYATDTLSVDEHVFAEDHLAGCDECAGLASLALQASGVLESWNAQTHRQAYLRHVLVRSLEQARQQPALAAWRDRLARWAEQWAGQAQGVIQVVFEGPRSAVQIVTEGLQELTRPGPAWQFAPVPAAIPIRGTGRRPGPAQPVIVSAGGDGASRVEVAASGERGEVEVQLTGLPIGVQPPLVMLVPADHAGEPRLALPVCPPDGDAWFARFEGLEAGEYLVAFEPMA